MKEQDYLERWIQYLLQYCSGHGAFLQSVQIRDRVSSIGKAVA